MSITAKQYREIAEASPIPDESTARGFFSFRYKEAVVGENGPVSVTPLSGYDDANFKVELEGKKNEAYLMKFFNPIQATTGALEAQVELINHLSSKGIKTPTIVPADDKEVTWDLMLKVKHPKKKAEGEKKEQGEEDDDRVRTSCRVQTWLQGDLFKANTAEKAAKVGEYLAQVRAALSSFKPGEKAEAYYKDEVHPWDMAKTFSAIPEIAKEVLSEDKKKLSLINDVVNAYETLYKNLEKTLPKGYLHGDVNDTNLIADNSGNNITGLIDFADTTHSFVVSEVAVSASYVALSAPKKEEALTFVKSFVNAYQKKSGNKLSADELKLLPVAIALRLAQSLVLGLFTSKINPDNTYVTETQAKGWEYLTFLFPTLKSSPKLTS